MIRFAVAPRYILLPVVFLLLSFFTISSVSAATVRVTGTAMDSSLSPLANSELIVKEAGTERKIGTVMTDSFGQYTLAVPQGTYDVILIPPAESGKKPLTKKNVEFTTDSMQDIAFDPPQSLPGVGSIVSAVNGIGTVTGIIILEVIAVLLGFAAYLLWKKKRRVKKR